MPPKHETVEILGVPITCCSFENVLEEIDEGIKNGTNGYISITNTESMYHAVRIPSHLEYIKNANLSCCDGIAIVLAGKMLGFKIPRLHGPDLVLECCKHGTDRGWRHFFYGGKKGVPEILHEKLAKKFPGLAVAGTHSPPFRPLTQEEDEELVEKINRIRPDILWVGLGLLKQEAWIAQHLGKIKAPWMVGVGAAFDFHAGVVKRAPQIFRQLGLEWLYRLAFEPRMLIRNLYSFSLFFQACKKSFKAKVSR